MARAIEDIVRDVENADVDGLAKTDVEDVYKQMDHLLQTRPSPIELYNLAEDLGEKTDLAQKQPEIYRDLKQRHLDWLRQFAN